MDYFTEFMKMGDDIMEAVSKAVSTNNYTNLSSDIKKQVARDQAKRQQEAARRRGTTTSSRQNPYGRVDIDLGTRGDQNAWKAQYAKQNAERQANMTKPNYQGTGKVYYNNNTGAGPIVKVSRPGAMPSKYEIDNLPATPFFKQKPRPGSATKKMAAGIAGLAVTTPIGLGLAIAATLAGGFPLIFWTGAMAAGFGASLWATITGKKERNLIKNYYNYGKLIGDAEYYPLELLAEKTYESQETVAKELGKMVNAKYLPQAKFDDQNTTLMLTDKAYSQYKEAEESRRRREKMAAAEKFGSGGVLTEEAAKIIDEGEAFLKEIRNSNELIPDEAITGKLNQLEKIVNKIFIQVRKDPSTAGDLNKFMNYYLPTTQKLINAYIELDRQPEVGDNITKTKKEINEALDTINTAFESLLDSLFEDVAWDISSDISTMKTMMAQDGLMQNQKK